MRLLIALLILAGCTNSNAEIDALRTELDSLKQIVNQQIVAEEKLDALPPTNISTVDSISASPQAEEFGEQVERRSKTEPVTPAEIATNERMNDTLFHYYVNGKVSVKIFPWENDSRKIRLFDLYGNLTFETEDIRKSYTQFNQLSFHPNGGVSVINESTNPGASMYMYHATMTFSTTNQPIMRTQGKTPASLEDVMEEQIPWFCNKQKGAWVKQEVSQETEMPSEYGPK